MTIVLNQELLAGFETRLREIGAAVVEHWAPGLDDRGIDELLGPCGIDPPAEARAWWKWHNGTMPAAPPTATYIIPSRDQTPLQGAVNLLSVAQERVEILNMTEVARHLQIVSNKPMLYVDCNGPRDAPAPIYSQNDDPEPPVIALPSMGELVTIWTQLIDDGVFATSPDGRWQRLDADRIPPKLRGRGII